MRVREEHGQEEQGVPVRRPSTSDETDTGSPPKGLEQTAARGDA